ncbi:hypothetical protein BHE74_00053666 [Ensete ventricosum]|nr:hypothetical protein BHE74_00053666 [Ensete ventricosum]
MHGSDEERSVTLFDDDVDRMYRKISTSKKKKKLVCFSFSCYSQDLCLIFFSLFRCCIYLLPSLHGLKCNIATFMYC